MVKGSPSATGLYTHERGGLRAQCLLEEKHYSSREAIKDSRLKGECVESRRIICFEEMTISILQLYLYLHKHSGIGGKRNWQQGDYFQSYCSSSERNQGGPRTG